MSQPDALLLCNFCDAENPTTNSRCGFCNIDFRDIPPREWTNSPNKTPARIRRPDPHHDVTGSYYGIPVIDYDENCSIALTNNPRRALAAVHACHRILGGILGQDREANTASDLASVWTHVDDVDGSVFFHADREHAEDVPSILVTY